MNIISSVSTFGAAKVKCGLREVVKIGTGGFPILTEEVCPMGHPMHLTDYITVAKSLIGEKHMKQAKEKVDEVVLMYCQKCLFEILPGNKLFACNSCSQQRSRDGLCFGGDGPPMKKMYCESCVASGTHLVGRVVGAARSGGRITDPPPIRDWSTGLFACCDHSGSCLDAFLCMPCKTGALVAFSGPRREGREIGTSAQGTSVKSMMCTFASMMLCFDICSCGAAGAFLVRPLYMTSAELNGVNTPASRDRCNSLCTAWFCRCCVVGRIHREFNATRKDLGEPLGFLFSGPSSDTPNPCKRCTQQKYTPPSALSRMTGQLLGSSFGGRGGGSFAGLSGPPGTMQPGPEQLAMFEETLKDIVNKHHLQGAKADKYPNFSPINELFNAEHHRILHHDTGLTVEDTWAALFGDRGQYNKLFHEVRQEGDFRDSRWTPINNANSGNSLPQGYKRLDYTLRLSDTVFKPGNETSVFCTLPAAASNTTDGVNTGGSKEMIIHASTTIPEAPMVGDTAHMEVLVHLQAIETIQSEGGGHGDRGKKQQGLDEARVGTLVVMYSMMKLPSAASRAMAEGKVRRNIEKTLGRSEVIVQNIVSSIHQPPQPQQHQRSGVRV